MPRRGSHLHVYGQNMGLWYGQESQGTRMYKGLWYPRYGGQRRGF
uniref:Uncharacterized protein n=1 Tax=Vitis vinifera TaxID=29760 RepID=F6HQB4_VITVI